MISIPTVAGTHHEGVMLASAAAAFRVFKNDDLQHVAAQQIIRDLVAARSADTWLCLQRRIHESIDQTPHFVRASGLLVEAAEVLLVASSAYLARIKLQTLRLTRWPTRLSSNGSRATTPN
jgi:hypothetical protein